jgi:transcriptional regulator of acetoin/glycerol metabolism
MTLDELRASLYGAGARRRQAEADRAEAMRELHELCRAAHGRMQVVEMARLSGLSRDTIHRVLRSTPELGAEGKG